MLTLIEFLIGLVYSLVSTFIYIKYSFFSKCFSSGSDLRDYYKQMKGVKKSMNELTLESNIELA